LPGSINGSSILSWTATGDDGNEGIATSYTIKYSTDSITDLNWASIDVFPNPPIPDSAGRDESIIIDPLIPGQSYFFGVIATDDVGNSSGIVTASGYTRGILTPNLVADSLKLDATMEEATLFSTVVNSYINFVYEFQLATDSLFNNPVTLTATNVTDFFASVTFSGLSSNVDYYCRVHAVAVDRSVQSEWSESLNFNLESGIINSSPLTPVVNSPQDGDTLTTLIPELVINNSTDPEGDILTYNFELYNVSATDLLSSVLNVIEGDQATSWEVPDGILSDNTWYSWRARAFDGNLYSSWSDFSGFVIITLGTGLADLTEVYAYPNPVRFSQGEQTTFILPDQLSDLLILTISGETVLLKSGLSGNWEWNGKNASGIDVATGVYLWYINGDKYRGKLVVSP